MTFPDIIKEGFSTFLVIFSAIVIWWIKVWFERRKEKASLLVAICAEIIVARNKILNELEGIIRAMKNENASYEYNFNFDPKVYNEAIKNIGLIGDKWVVKIIVQSYGLIEDLKYPIATEEDKYKLPINAHKMDLVYRALDGIEGFISDKYDIKADITNTIDSAEQLKKRIDVKNEMRNVMFDKYKDLSMELYKSTNNDS